MAADTHRPTIAVTLGDPRGIGPEVTWAAISDPGLSTAARYIVVGPEDASDSSLSKPPAAAEFISIGKWSGSGSSEAGSLSAVAIDRAISLALSGEVDGIVTGPISKSALQEAGYAFPGHTELLRERCGVPDVTMIMAAESTPLGGPLRVALLTVHIPLREVAARLDEDLVVRRTTIAARALRDWWGLARPRLALAGVNPHASERGLFGDEEERILRPAACRLGSLDEFEIAGIYPADTVFRRCVDGSIDAVVAPYHDVGLAVLKTVAGDTGVNVTAGLPFPRTSPDHGTAFDIAGRGIADPSSMKAAVRQCIRFCRSGR